MMQSSAFSFVFFNWLELIGFITMLYHIRNIRDELSIKNELQVVFGAWFFTSIVYFSTTAVAQQSGKEHQTTFRIIQLSFILIRDLSAVLAMVAFSFWTYFRDPDRVYPGAFEHKLLALEFETVMNSCLPFEYFYQYIEEKKPKQLIYIKVYALVRLHDQSKEDLQSKSDPSSSNNNVTSLNSKNSENDLLKIQDQILDLIKREDPDGEFFGDLKSANLRASTISNLNNVYDFKDHMEVCSAQLRQIYQNEFRQDPLFEKLIDELIRNEIEFKFLSYANVVH